MTTAYDADLLYDASIPYDGAGAAATAATGRKRRGRVVYPEVPAFARAVPGRLLMVCLPVRARGETRPTDEELRQERLRAWRRREEIETPVGYF